MISIRSLSKYFDEVKAVDRVNLQVQKGQSRAIFGPSGSGKTTLLRLIAGLETPDEGEILIEETLMSSPGLAVPPHQRNLGFMFQSPALWPHMDVAENILFGLHALPKQAALQRMEEILDWVGLSGLEGRYPAQLSGGQSRRVALARTLAPKPKLLLMDEPFTSVDPDLKVDLLDLVKDTVRLEGMTLLLVTHDKEEAIQVTNGNLMEMVDGRILEIPDTVT
jgi:ABC-type Fe3+/spermidine/putrescine transport system ATPase subunit